MESRNRFLFEHVVAGIAGYGNCVGVPTVGGEVAFHPRYSGNPLVNAMCVGLLKLDEVTTAAASGVGNPVIYLGLGDGQGRNPRRDVRERRAWGKTARRSVRTCRSAILLRKSS